MTRTRTVAVIVAVVLAVGLAGCGAMSADGGSADSSAADINTSNYDASELASSASTTMSEVESYTFTTDISIEASDDTSTASIEMEGDGKANHATERMYMDMHMDIDAGMRSVSEDVEAYQVGDTVHMKVRGDWQSQPAQQATWTGTGPGMQSELLADSDVSIEGTETVNGEETIVVSVDPDEQTLEELAKQQSSTDASNEDMEIRSASVTQYVSPEEPHYVVKSEIQMTAVSDDGVTMSMNATTTMDDHEEDISIDVPDEAR